MRDNVLMNKISKNYKNARFFQPIKSNVESIDFGVENWSHEIRQMWALMGNRHALSRRARGEGACTHKGRTTPLTAAGSIHLLTQDLLTVRRRFGSGFWHFRTFAILHNRRYAGRESMRLMSRTNNRDGWLKLEKKEPTERTRDLLTRGGPVD